MGGVETERTGALEEMNVFIVLFKIADVRRRAQFVAFVRTLGTWMSYFDGVLITRTNHSMAQVETALVSRIGQADTLLIIEGNPHKVAGYMPQEAWDWLNG